MGSFLLHAPKMLEWCQVDRQTFSGWEGFKENLSISFGVEPCSVKSVQQMVSKTITLPEIISMQQWFSSDLSVHDLNFHRWWKGLVCHIGNGKLSHVSISHWSLDLQRDHFDWLFFWCGAVGIQVHQVEEVTSRTREPGVFAWSIFYHKWSKE